MISQGTSPFYLNFKVFVNCLHCAVGHVRTKVAASIDGIHYIEKILFVLRFKLVCFDKYGSCCNVRGFFLSRFSLVKKWIYFLKKWTENWEIIILFFGFFIFPICLLVYYIDKSFLLHKLKTLVRHLEFVKYQKGKLHSKFKSKHVSLWFITLHL